MKRDSLMYKTDRMLTSRWFWGVTAVSAVAVTLASLIKQKFKHGKE